MPDGQNPSRSALIARFRAVRDATERLAAPLSSEDQMLQSMPDCSPTKWHRAHTTWFFERFVLAPHGVESVNAQWGRLFNSYYVTVGPRHARARRGLLSRPSSEEVGAYRRTIDDRVVKVLSRLDEGAVARIQPTVELGLAHEEQHQELILTDILNAFHESPLLPAYRSRQSSPEPRSDEAVPAMRFFAHEGGLGELGADPADGFAFDNEAPRHRTWVDPFELADRLVTVGEWKAFADAGAYEKPALWLSEGFDWVQANGVRAPLYATREGAALMVFGLDGLREARDDEPLAHVSYYEADAIARFLGARLPTEAEWELVARGSSPAEGNFIDDGTFHPLRARPSKGAPAQLFGDVWEWTCSSYAPYPGFAAAEGPIGEYNGKFMINQLVLRGGSCFTPRGHVRASYRNFWHPHTRFQVAGVRVARTPRR